MTIRDGHDAVDAVFRFLILLGAVMLAYLLSLFFAGYALPQQHHSQHHAIYQNWINRNGKGCCNDRDCGELAHEHERETPSGLEVRIEGQWCPVRPWHYLQQGNAPNWQASHVCVLVQNEFNKGVGPCERLLCFQPKPQF